MVGRRVTGCVKGEGRLQSVLAGFVGPQEAVADAAGRLRVGSCHPVSRKGVAVYQVRGGHGHTDGGAGEVAHQSPVGQSGRGEQWAAAGWGDGILVEGTAACVVFKVEAVQ